MKTRTNLFLILSMAALSAAPLYADGVVDPKSIHKVIIIGDSISYHPSSPTLAWTGTWGMAASAADKDYVHLFVAKLTAAQGAGAPAPEVWNFSEGGGKVTDKVPFLEKITAFHADLALVQLGENDHQDITAENFQQPYEKLLAAIRAGNPNACILCSGVWGVWPTGDQTKNKLIRAACEKYGATFSDLGNAYTDPANRAASEHLFTDSGVNWHPSDAGMAAYADAFWKAFTSPAPAPVNVAATDAATPSPAQANAAPAGPEAAPVAMDETWSEPPSLTWTPVPPMAQDDGRNIARISSTDATKGVMFGTAFNVANFTGREVKIQTRVKADSISELPNPWNGVKIMLRIRNAEGKIDYPQYKLPAGTFPWTDVSWTVQIPDNAVELYFYVGLENVTGTACFDAIHITAGTNPSK